MIDKIRTFSLLFCMISVAWGTNIFGQPVVSERLQQTLTLNREDQHISVNIFLEQQYDNALLFSQSRDIPDKTQRRQFIIDELKEFSHQQQADLLFYLKNLEKLGKVRKIQSLWIGNMIVCEVLPEVMHELSARKDIARLDQNVKYNVLMDDIFNSEELLAKKDILNSTNIAWHITKVNANQVWDENYMGENIIVAVFDTGINYNHQDLDGNMWEHPDYPNHGFNFFDHNHNTLDANGHGTHVAGIVAGNGSSGTITGIAPNAKIMNLKVTNNDGMAYEYQVWDAIQFAVEYGAHIVNMSLGWLEEWEPNKSMWRTALNNMLNAGLIASIASGNEGTAGIAPPFQVRTPGNVPPPWTHPSQTLTGGNSSVVSVGATRNTDELSNFSSKGPVTWQDVSPFNDYPYDPEMGLIRPDVVAPGQAISSLVFHNNYGYTNKSGTSMAAPVVAGVMALILSKNPALLPEQISQILEETALAFDSIKNNSFGSGRVDALAAIEATPFMKVGYAGHTINDSQGNNNGKINPGEFITINLMLSNLSEENAVNIEGQLTTMSPYITIVDSIATIGELPAGDTIQLDNIFTFQVADNIPSNHIIRFTFTAFSSDNPDETWPNYFTDIAYAPRIEFSGWRIEDNLVGNNNGQLEPGETANTYLTLSNTGQFQSDSVLLQLLFDPELMTVLSGNSIFSDGLEAGESKEVSYAITVFHHVPLLTTTELVFNAISAAYQFHNTEEVLVGGPVYYDGGHIPTTLRSSVNPNHSSDQPGLLSISIPFGATITGVDLSYDFTSHNGAWMSNQRSFLRCVSPGGTTEPEVISGELQSQGTEHYNRSGLTIANNVSGVVSLDFELHAFRTWGGSGTNTEFAYIPDNSWNILVHYDTPIKEVTFRLKNQFNELLENAIVSVATNQEITNDLGEAYFELAHGNGYYLSVIADKHRNIDFQMFNVNLATDVIFVNLLKVFQVDFNITDSYGNVVTDPVIVFNGDTLLPGHLYIDDLPDGQYSYSVSAADYNTYEGVVEIIDQDVILSVVLSPDGTSIDNIIQSDIKVYPNPTQDYFQIRSEHTIYHVNIFDVLGRKVFSEEVNYKDAFFDVQLESGTYIIDIITDRGAQIKKLIVR